MQSPIVHVVCDAAFARYLADLRFPTRYRVDVVDSIAVWCAARRPATPTCVVVDVEDDAPPELDAALWSRLRAIGATVVVVYRGADLRFAVQAMREGAVDVLAPPIDDTALRAAIDAAATQAIASHEEALRTVRARHLFATCTHRERAVLTRVARGLLNKQIAIDLACTESTVKVHRSRAMRKLGVRSPVQLIHLVESAGVNATRTAP
ncbi:MAG: hypothetical protein IT522_05775 [Burkholderiales bacterium]|nr:hypothetical protein [Burkholderiales bacterium]